MKRSTKLISATNLPLVTVVIPTCNRKSKLSRLIESVLATTYPLNKVEVIVVDDASTDGTCAEIEGAFAVSNVKVIGCQEKKQVSECRNIGTKKSKGEYIFFVDDDVILSRTAISELVVFMQSNKNVGVAGPMILQFNRPNLIWCAGIKENYWTTLGKFIGQNEPDGQFTDPVICDAVPTAFMAPKRIAVDTPFDSTLFPIQFEEIDFCVRIKRSGYKVVVLPWIKIWHDHQSATFLRDPTRTYFVVRNRFIRHKLWSTNRWQYVTSGIFALLISLTYIIISTKHATNLIKTVNAIFRGLIDGLRLSLTLNIPDIYRGKYTTSKIDDTNNSKKVL